MFLPEREVVVVVKMEHLEVVGLLETNFGNALMVINGTRRWPSPSKDVGDMWSPPLCRARFCNLCMIARKLDLDKSTYKRGWYLDWRDNGAVARRKIQLQLTLTIRYPFDACVQCNRVSRVIKNPALFFQSRWRMKPTQVPLYRLWVWICTVTFHHQLSPSARRWAPDDPAIAVGRKNLEQFQILKTKVHCHIPTPTFSQ
jgi:hypothetical protein